METFTSVVLKKSNCWPLFWLPILESYALMCNSDDRVHVHIDVGETAGIVRICY